MKSVVIDANVIIKWVFPEREIEDYQSQAIQLLHAIKKNKLRVYQPPHWMAEVTAVIVRLRPEIAEEAINLLHALEFPVIEDPEIYYLAGKLSEQYKHHLFDTLYHATALYSGHTFITSDEKYYHKVFKSGAIFRLAEYFAFEVD